MNLVQITSEKEDIKLLKIGYFDWFVQVFSVQTFSHIIDHFFRDWGCNLKAIYSQLAYPLRSLIKSCFNFQIFPDVRYSEGSGIPAPK